MTAFNHLSKKDSTKRSFRLGDRRGVSLVETMVAVTLLAMLMSGVLATLTQSRRLTEGSIYQNSTVTIMQGYIEQMKNMDFSLLVPSPATAPSTAITIPTVIDQDTPDALTLSWGTPPSTMPAVGTTPTGAVDNNKSFDINNTPSTTNDDLRLNVWVWIQQLERPSLAATTDDAPKAITMIYTWQFKDGSRIRYFRSSIRSVRSLVPTY